MNPANYDIKTVIVNQGLVGIIDLPCCKRCGNLVGDMEQHDTHHDQQNANFDYLSRVARLGF